MEMQESVAVDPRASNGQVASADAAAMMEQIRSGEIATVIVGGCDTNGVLRAKRVAAERFAAMAEPAIQFSEYIWAVDIVDHAQPTPEGLDGWPSWETGFGDVDAVADLGTLRRVPWLERTAIVLCSYRYEPGREYEAAPRNVLQRVLDRYRELGLEPVFAPEFEFIVLRETEESALEKGFRDLRPLSSRAMPLGGMLATIDDHLIGRVVDGLAGMGVRVEAWNPEGARGQYELNVAHAPVLEAADVGFLFKHGVKEICALEGMMATFVPRISEDDYGSSMHVHQSLWREGESVFHDPDAADGMSKPMRHFVAGQLQTLIPFAPIWRPTPLAYKRGGVHSAAGTTETWGWDNKTLSLRVLADRPGSCRVEHRVAGADANVYLAMAAMLAGGLHGIENELELPPPTTGDAYLNDGLRQIPPTLEDALPAFEASAVAKEYLGEEFVRRYAATRRWEVEQARRAVTDWELERYLARA